MKPKGLAIGFHRLGIALAIIPAFAATLMLIYGVYQWAQPAIAPPVFKVSNSETKKTHEFIYHYNRDRMAAELQKEFGSLSLPRSVAEELEKNMAVIDRQRSEGLSFIALAGATAALALLVYALSWIVGWIVRGFAGDNN